MVCYYRLVEEGRMMEAEELKERLEQQQRARLRPFTDGKAVYSPTWFTSVFTSTLILCMLQHLRYSNTTVYYGIHECSECIPADSGVTNSIHDRRSCVDFTLEVEANVARCVHSSVNKPGVKRNSGL